MTAVDGGNPLTNGEPLAGPGLDAWLTLGVRLESLTAEIEETNRRRRRLWDTLHQVPLTGPPLAAAGDVVDEPNLTGPRTGWFWDLARLSFRPAELDAPWVGTIYVYDGPDGELLDTFTPPVYVHDYSDGSRLLHPHQRLVYVAGPDFDGGLALIGGTANQAADDCVPLYLGAG